jgi:signal transduction histidine kinase
MKAVYLKTMVCATVILVVCLASFAFITRYTAYDLWEGSGPLARLIPIGFEGTVHAYQTGGAQKLSTYIADFHTAYPNNHIYLLMDGVDLRTNSDLSDLKRQADSPWQRFHFFGPIFLTRSSPDRRYEFILTAEPLRSPFRTYAMYYVVLLFAVAILCWVLLFQFAAPLAELTGVVRSFGDGRLNSRVKSVRNDGIGELGQAFNQMADRIQALLAAERQLLQDISHELRSPLARLSVAAELTRNPEDRDSAISQIHKEIDRLTGLLEGLIQVTRAKSDAGTQSLSHVLLDELIRELIDDNAIEAAARECRLQLKGSAGLSLLADRELLRRAIENLLRNAIRYSPEHSTIEVEVIGTESSASISVRDYGPGVPAEALSQIFDPFFRVDDSRDMATGGMGLGLSISQRAVHLHHGQIRAENANPGLRISMDLPLNA